MIAPQLGGPYGSLPVALLLSTEWRELSRSAQGAVLLIVARQNLHGGWRYTTRSLADDLGVSVHSARQAITEANRAGILAVRDEVDDHGVVCSRWFSVPCTLPRDRQTIKVEPKKPRAATVEDDTPPLSETQTAPLSEIQTAPLSEIQTPSSYRENDQEKRSPQPPAERGARDRSQKRSRRASRVVSHPELGLVDLSRVPDPKLRSRDHRRIDAMLAERNAADAEERAMVEQREAVAAILGTVPQELRSIVALIDQRISASVLRSEHPAMQHLCSIRHEAEHLGGRAAWNLTVDEAHSLVDLARGPLDADALTGALDVLDGQDAAERDKRARIQPMLSELTGTLAGIETIVHELTLAMVAHRRLADPATKPVRLAVFSVADRAKAAKARLLAEWTDEAELADVGAMLVQLSSEAQGLRPMLG